MTVEPQCKRAIVFVDGQNLFHAAKTAFGYQYPNYDVACLASAICREQEWQLDRKMYDSCLDPRDYRSHGDAK